jgi:hypothetical protein
MPITYKLGSGKYEQCHQQTLIECAWQVIRDDKAIILISGPNCENDCD